MTTAVRQVVYAVIYVRVSTARQESEGYSLDAQLEMCRAYAQSEGLTVVEEYVEVESASSLGRPRFAAMLQALRRRRGMAVIAQSTDRLHRNMEDPLALERTGAAVHLVHEGGASQTGTAMGRFTGRLRASLAALYSDRLAEETRKGQRAKAQAGIWPTVAPIGFLNVLRDGRRVIEPDDRLVPVLRELFARCAQGATLDELRDWAAAAGLRKPGALRALSRSRIADVLKARVYHGMVEWSGEVYQGSHRAIITEAEWQAARDALVGRRARGPRCRRREHLYGGRLIRCECGSWLVGDTKIQRHGHRYVYYRCSGGAGEHHRYIREELIEGMLVEGLRGLRLPVPAVEMLRCGIRDLAAEHTAGSRIALARLRARLTQIEDRERRSYQAYLDGMVSADAHREAAARSRAERTAVEGELAGARGVEEADADLAVGLLELAQGAADVLPRCPAGVRRELLRFYASALVLERDAGSIRIEWGTPWDALIRTRETVIQSGAEAPEQPSAHTWLRGQDADRTQDGVRWLLRVKRATWMDEAQALLRAA